MKLMSVECPKCGGRVEVDESLKRCFCMYCRTEIQVNSSVSEGTNSGLHHEFEAAMAIARRKEDLYKQGKSNFITVMDAYDDVEAVGAHIADYWLKRSRFLMHALEKEISNGKFNLSKRQEMLDSYRLWMEEAILYFNGIKSAVEAEKEQGIAKINVIFEKRAEEERKRREDEEERKRRELEEQERQSQLAREQWEAEAPIRREKRIRALIVVALLLIVVFFFMQWQKRQEVEAERQRIQAEIEAEVQRQVDLIEAQASNSNLPLKGLIEWADKEGINYEHRVNDVAVEGEILSKIETYGLVGNFLNATAGFSSIDETEIILVFNWEDVSYDNLIYELAHLDNKSEDVIRTWLDDGGLTHLESQFDNVRVQNIDQDYFYISNDTPFEKEFIKWYFIKPENTENIHVYIQYEVQTPTREEAHEIILETLNSKEKDKPIYISDLARVNTKDVATMAEILQIHPDWLRVEPHILRLRIYNVDQNGEELTSRDRRNVTADQFTSWTYTDRIIVLQGRNNEEQLEITIYQAFDVDSDTSGFSRANFELIENGMNIEQVNGLIARDGRLSSSSGDVEIYSWLQAYTNKDVAIYVTFTDGSVTGKEWTETPK